MGLDALMVNPAMLGDRSWDYLEEVCRQLPELGLVVCSARTNLLARVRGLRMGVDDWITKPFHPEEALARIETVSRSQLGSPVGGGGEPLVFGGLEIQPDQFQALLDGTSLNLTRREFEVLHLLAGSAGRVIEREAIYQRVWGYAMVHGDRSVDVFVRKLRGKLEPRAAGRTYIHTHFGVGYRFEPDPPIVNRLESSPRPRAEDEGSRRPLAPIHLG